MADIQVPTSRAASLVVVKDKVARDMFYDGRMKMEPCAVVLRIAPTWFRWALLPCAIFDTIFEKLTIALNQVWKL